MLDIELVLQTRVELICPYA